MNEVRLQEGHPVDENLRPIKVGGKSTAIETAQHGDGARINGDLEVTGDIKGNIKDMVLEDVTLDSLTTDSIVSTNLTIDDSYDIYLNATTDINIPADVGLTFGNDGEKIEGDGTDLSLESTGDILLKPSSLSSGDVKINAGVISTIEFFNGSNGVPYIKLMSLIDTGDYCKIATATNGATTITTVDDDGTGANLTLDIDGKVDINSSPSDDIELDAGGDIILDADGISGTAIKDEDTLSSNSATHLATQQSIKAYVDTGDNTQYHFIRIGFYNSGTAIIYLPMPGAEDMRELTSSTGASERLSFLCPFDGSVETIWARSEYAAGSTIIRAYFGTTAVEVPSSIGGTAVTVDMHTDDTSYEFDFAGGGSNTFSQGNILMFSVDPTVQLGDCHFMIVLKFDVST